MDYVWSLLGYTVAYIVVGALVCIIVYAAVRVGSFAYFRTKYDYLRKVLHRINRGD